MTSSSSKLSQLAAHYETVFTTLSIHELYSYLMNTMYIGKFDMSVSFMYI